MARPNRDNLGAPSPSKSCVQGNHRHDTHTPPPLLLLVSLPSFGRRLPWYLPPSHSLYPSTYPPCTYPTPSPRGALEGKGPQRWPRKRLGRRLEEVAKAVRGGYCRLQMPLKLARAVRGTVAGHRLGSLEPTHPLPQKGGIPGTTTITRGTIGSGSERSIARTLGRGHQLVNEQLVLRRKPRVNAPDPGVLVLHVGHEAAGVARQPPHVVEARVPLARSLRGPAEVRRPVPGNADEQPQRRHVGDEHLRMDHRGEVPHQRLRLPGPHCALAQVLDEARQDPQHCPNQKGSCAGRHMPCGAGMC